MTKEQTRDEVQRDEIIRLAGALIDRSLVIAQWLGLRLSVPIDPSMSRNRIDKVPVEEPDYYQAHYMLLMLGEAQRDLKAQIDDVLRLDANNEIDEDEEW